MMREHIESKREAFAVRGLVKLSPRLKAVADFVRPGSRIADIGTDHGYIPIYLAQTGRVRTALAMDVRKGPLERARLHLEEYGLTARAGGQDRPPVETRLGDGLKELKPGEADTVIIAGMGGGLVIRILEQGRFLWDSLKHFILSPQSDLDKVRQYLYENGFCIEDEAMAKDEGKYYFIISAVRGAMEPQTQVQYRYGKILMEKKDHLLAEYLDREMHRVRTIIEGLEAGEGSMTQGRQKALEDLKSEEERIKEAQDEMQ